MSVPQLYLPYNRISFSRCVGTHAKAEDTPTSGATSPPCCGDTARPSTCSIRPRCGTGMGQFRIQSSDSLMNNDLSRPPYCRLLFSCKGVRLDPGCTDVTFHKSGWPLLQFYPELASFRPRYNDSLPAAAVAVDVRGRFCRDRCVKVSQSLLRLRRRK